MVVSEAPRRVPYPGPPPGSTTTQFGFWTAIGTAVLTLITFGLAITAIPNSGRNCQADCATYPFDGGLVASQFPGDYLWMVPAMLLMPLFVALVATIHQLAPVDRKVFSLIGLCLAVVAASVLLIDYFVQFTVMQPSLEKGGLEGWALLTMYNPNGVFLALEELGLVLMSVAFVAIAPAFTGRTAVERVLRLVLVIGFVATIGALGLVTAFLGSIARMPSRSRRSQLCG